MPEPTDHLDDRLRTALDALDGDVATRTHAPGTDVVFARVRRRRAGAGVAGVAALALVASGAWMLLPTSITHREVSESQVATGTDTAGVPARVRPAPREWAPANFPTALAAWGPWTRSESDPLPRPACLNEALRSATFPERASSSELALGGAGVEQLFAEFNIFEPGAEPASEFIPLEACGVVTTLDYEGGAVVRYVITPDVNGKPWAVFLAASANGVAYGEASGLPAEPDRATLEVTADALLAGLDYKLFGPAAPLHSEGPSGETVTAAPLDGGHAFRTLDSAQFARAIAAWDPTWQAQPGAGTGEGSTKERPLPCLPDLELVSASPAAAVSQVSTVGSSAGSSAYSVIVEFDGNPEQARSHGEAAVKDLTERLTTCANAPWTSTAISLRAGGGGTVLTTAEGTVFVVHRDGMVHAVSVQGASNPPLDVSNEVIGLLWTALDPARS